MRRRFRPTSRRSSGSRGRPPARRSPGSRTRASSAAASTRTCCSPSRAGLRPTGSCGSSGSSSASRRRRSATRSTSASSAPARSHRDSTTRRSAASGRPSARPERCPHGWPVDPERSRRETRGLFALSSAAEAGDVAVERLDETSRERLKALLAAGIEPGSSLGQVNVNVAAGMVGFVTAGEPRAISLLLAGSVLVRAA